MKGLIEAYPVEVLCVFVNLVMLYRESTWLVHYEITSIKLWEALCHCGDDGDYSLEENLHTITCKKQWVSYTKHL